MTTADNDPTTTTPQDGSCRQPLLAIEEPLRSLAAATSLLGHLAVSELEIEGDEIEAVQTASALTASSQAASPPVTPQSVSAVVRGGGRAVDLLESGAQASPRRALAQERP
jgi:hypothetical protein